MRKTLLGAALMFGLGFIGTSANAQTFSQAVAEYKQETGTTTYQGQELQPEWFKNKTKDHDTNGDGIIDARSSWSEFWLFGHCFWQGPVRVEKV